MPIVVNSNVTATTASFNLSARTLPCGIAWLACHPASGLSTRRMMPGAWRWRPNCSQNCSGRRRSGKMFKTVYPTFKCRTVPSRSWARFSTACRSFELWLRISPRIPGTLKTIQKSSSSCKDELSQTAREKFNGISLFASSSTSSANNPLRPQLSREPRSMTKASQLQSFPVPYTPTPVVRLRMGMFPSE